MAGLKGIVAIARQSFELDSHEWQFIPQAGAVPKAIAQRGV
jgi:hypothetical protein